MTKIVLIALVELTTGLHDGKPVIIAPGTVLDENVLAEHGLGDADVAALVDQGMVGESAAHVVTEGDASDAFEAMRQRAIDAEAKVNALQSDLDASNKALDAAKSQVTDLQNQLAAATKAK